MIRTVLSGLISVGLMAACTSAEEPTPDPPDWGPVTVVNAKPGGGSEALIGEGRLEIGELCVTLEMDGRSVLLVWRADQTRWNAGSRSIVFSRGQGSLELHDGDDVIATGGGVGAEGEPLKDLVSGLDESCADDAALVTDIDLRT